MGMPFLARATRANGMQGIVLMPVEMLHQSLYSRQKGCFCKQYLQPGVADVTCTDMDLLLQSFTLRAFNLHLTASSLFLPKTLQQRLNRQAPTHRCIFGMPPAPSKTNRQPLGWHRWLGAVLASCRSTCIFPHAILQGNFAVRQNQMEWKLSDA